ncbi:hypothetical protein SAMN05660880_00240 [Luteibacter sp. 22Crub2.1]|nr:hypothetical protein SAMN05660880_00240 [Luteibacter sp. 22Crub2.1]
MDVVGGTADGQNVGPTRRMVRFDFAGEQAHDRRDVLFVGIPAPADVVGGTIAPWCDLNEVGVGNGRAHQSFFLRRETARLAELADRPQRARQRRYVNEFQHQSGCSASSMAFSVRALGTASPRAVLSKMHHASRPSPADNLILVATLSMNVRSYAE